MSFNLYPAILNYLNILSSSHVSNEYERIAFVYGFGAASLAALFIVEQFKKRTRTYRVRQVGRLYATQLYERVTLFLKLFRYKWVDDRLYNVMSG